MLHRIFSTRNLIFYEGPKFHVEVRKISKKGYHQLGVLTMRMASNGGCFSGTNMLFCMYFYMFVTNSMTEEDKRLRDRRTPRCALDCHKHSSFKYLYNSGDDQALLNCCGTTHAVFNELLALFEPYFNSYTLDDQGNLRKFKHSRKRRRIIQRGRKRDLDAIGCLGLVLYWYRTRGSVARAVSMAFGLTATPMYKWLKFGRHLQQL